MTLDKTPAIEEGLLEHSLAIEEELQLNNLTKISVDELLSLNSDLGNQFASILHSYHSGEFQKTSVERAINITENLLNGGVVFSYEKNQNGYGDDNINPSDYIEGTILQFKDEYEQSWSLTDRVDYYTMMSTESIEGETNHSSYMKKGTYKIVNKELELHSQAPEKIEHAPDNLENWCFAPHIQVLTSDLIVFDDNQNGFILPPKTYKIVQERLNYLQNMINKSNS